MIKTCIWILKRIRIGKFGIWVDNISQNVYDVIFYINVLYVELCFGETDYDSIFGASKK